MGGELRKRIKEEVLFQSLRMPKSFGKIWVVLKRTNLFVVVVERADSSCNLLLGCWFLGSRFFGGRLGCFLCCRFLGGLLGSRLQIISFHKFLNERTHFLLSSYIYLFAHLTGCLLDLQLA